MSTAAVIGSPRSRTSSSPVGRGNRLRGGLISAEAVWKLFAKRIFGVLWPLARSRKSILARS